MWGFLVYESRRHGFGDNDAGLWWRGVVHGMYVKVAVDGMPDRSSPIDIGTAIKLQERRYATVLSGSVQAINY